MAPLTPSPASPAVPEPSAPPTPRPLVRNLRELLLRNPVVLKELRGRMRGWRAPLVLTIYLALMSTFVLMFYAVFTLSNNTPSNTGVIQFAGKFVFWVVGGIELLLVCFIAPAFTAGAISGERERQTFDLLRTTLLTASSFVIGKLTSALSYVLLLLLAAIPLQSLALLLGGVTPEEILLATVMLIATAFLFSTAGLFFSSFMRRTLGATVFTYGFALFINLALPLALMVILPFGSFFFSQFSPSPFWEGVMLYAFGIGIMLNPLATVITTETLLLNDGTLFYFTIPVGGVDLPFLSPWLPYVFWCFLASLLFVLFAIGMVGRPEN